MKKKEAKYNYGIFQYKDGRTVTLKIPNRKETDGSPVFGELNFTVFILETEIQGICIFKEV